VTYEGLAAAWPTMTDEVGVADKMNSMPKYGVSTTLEEAPRVEQLDADQRVSRKKSPTSSSSRAATSWPTAARSSCTR
jgi:hypothetical protein